MLEPAPIAASTLSNLPSTEELNVVNPVTESICT